jgi:threonine/homoserine/homoserine lactone efflux protein
MVAATGLERGFRVALPIALAPLITDVPPMVVSALVVQRLDWAALTLLGISGGVVILMIGVRFLRAHGIPRLQEHVTKRASLDAPAPGGQSVRLGHVLTTNLLNPAPWVFWFVVAAPLLVIQWNASRVRGVVFVVVLFAVNVLSAAGLAWAASHARRVLAPENQRRVLVVAGLALACAGTLMVWQSLEGNFQALIEGQTAVRGILSIG